MTDSKLLKLIITPCDFTVGWRLLSQFFVAAVFGTAAIHVTSFTTRFILKLESTQVIELAAIGLSLFAGVTLWPILWKISKLPSRSALYSGIKAKEEALEAMTRWTSNLEERTSHYKNLATLNDQRYDLVLNTFSISTFHNDLDHKYIWAHNSFRNDIDFSGKSDSDIFDPIIAQNLTAIKKRAIADGSTQSIQISLSIEGRTRHFQIQTAPRKDHDGTVVGTVSVSSDITDRVEWQAKSLLLLREVNHRSRNLLAIVNAIMMQTGRRCSNISEYKDKLQGRISSLSRSIHIITEDLWSESSILDLFKAQLELFPSHIMNQIRVQAGELELPHKIIQNLGLAFYELLSNSMKYGALSQESGTVDLSWSCAEQGNHKIFRLRWSESGLSNVHAPGYRGFGLRALENVLANELGGTAEIDWQPNGLLYTMEIPVRQL